MANNSNKPLLIVVVAVAVSTMGAGFFVALGTAQSGSASIERGAAPAAQQVVEAAPRAVPVPDPSASPTQPPSIRRNAMARDVKREQIWSALSREHRLEPAAPGSAAPSEETAARLPELDVEYIRATITEQLLPVATECYESALVDDPKLAGTIVSEFTIVGAEDVGGVVEEAAIKADESTLDSEFVRECIRESLLAVTFEPPPDGGQLQVTNAFEFRP